jgi:hypothetical protein
MSMTTTKITINCAPVLTLWATVVAERLGYDSEAALTLGKTVAGLNAQSKGRRLGLFEDARDQREARAPWVVYLQRAGNSIARKSGRVPSACG